MYQKPKFPWSVYRGVTAVRWTGTLCQLLPTADSINQEAQSKMSKVRVQRLIRSCKGAFWKATPVDHTVQSPQTTVISPFIVLSQQDWWSERVVGEGHLMWDMHREGNTRTSQQKWKLPVWFSYRQNTWIETLVETQWQPSVHYCLLTSNNSSAQKKKKEIL